MAAVATMGIGIASPGTAGASSSAPGVTAKQITVGLDTELTGVAATNFDGALQGTQARFDLQNAEGGVDGRKIKLIVKDDQSNPAVAQTAVASLIQDNVFGLIFNSDLLGEAYKQPQQLGVPVIGAPIDGPEWGTKPNTNMVSILGDQSPELPGYTDSALEAKLLGAKNMAAFAIDSDPASVNAALDYVKSAAAVGLKVGYVDTSVPFGTVDTTDLALAMKKEGVDGFQSFMLDTTDFAIMASAKQAGLNLVAPMDVTSYTSDLLKDPTALSSAQGIVVGIQQTPVEEHTAATRIEQAAFKKYEHFDSAPSISWTYGWLSADLFIQGLKGAGQNPTRASFLSALRSLKGWTAEGLMPTAANFSLKDFGKAPPTQCNYFVKLKGSTYTVLNKGKAICGKAVS